MKNMIAWFNLVPDQEQYCATALSELTVILKVRYPELPEVGIMRIPTMDEAPISRVSHIADIAGYRDNQASDWNHANKIFGFCKGVEDFVCAAQRKNEMAVWGATWANEVALSWIPDNKFLIWHEFMHLLFAKDCYDDGDGCQPCSEQYCLMQYAPTAQSCHDGFFLCPQADLRIRHMNKY